MRRRFIDMRSVNAKLDARDRRFQRDAELQRAMRDERVQVCSWCSDAPERVASARAHGRDIHYTMCGACKAAFEAGAKAVLEREQ